MSQTPFRAPRTVKGSCHCGAVRFEFDFQADQGTSRCNCTNCTKSAYWGAGGKPSALRLLAGEESLGDYSRSEYGHHHFCKVCGIRVFGRGHIPELGGDYASMNLNCLDETDLTGINVQYIDGRHDTWATLHQAPYRSPFLP